MLTSSDAKFRCLWHMFIWSILLTLVSQFYVISHHIAFYIFGSLCILVLPIVTSLYSNTAGRRGVGFLRVSYVLCDPVIACMGLVPVLLINHLTPLIHEMECLSEDIHSWNESLTCLGDYTSSTPSKLKDFIIHNSVPFRFMTALWLERRQLLTAIEASVTIPCIIALLMGRRTRKMSGRTALLAFAYWLVASIECCGMIEASILCGSYRLHYAVTTEVTVSVACIVANSYALVTLCSYISPMRCKGDKKQVAAHFDFVYKCVVGVLVVAFVELPQLIARMQMLLATSDWPSSFEVNSFIKESHLASLNNAASHHVSSVMHQENTTPNTSVTLSPFNISSILNKIISNFNQTSDTLSTTTTAIPPTKHLPSTHATIPNNGPTNAHKLSRLGFPPSFYIWAFKDAIMIIIIIALLILQRFERSAPAIMKILGEGQECVGTAFDNLNTVFVPEKRDKYIITKCAKCKQIDLKEDGSPSPQNHLQNAYSSKNKSHRSHYTFFPQSTNYYSNDFSFPQPSFNADFDKQLKETSFSNEGSETFGRIVPHLNKTDDFKEVHMGDMKDESKAEAQSMTVNLLEKDQVTEDLILNDLIVSSVIPTTSNNGIRYVNNSLGAPNIPLRKPFRLKNRLYSLEEDSKKKKKSVKFSFS